MKALSNVYPYENKLKEKTRPSTNLFILLSEFSMVSLGPIVALKRLLIQVSLLENKILVKSKDEKL